MTNHRDEFSILGRIKFSYTKITFTEQSSAVIKKNVYKRLIMIIGDNGGLKKREKRSQQPIQAKSTAVS